METVKTVMRVLKFLSTYDFPNKGCLWQSRGLMIYNPICITISTVSFSNDFSFFSGFILLNKKISMLVKFSWKNIRVLEIEKGDNLNANLYLSLW